MITFVRLNIFRHSHRHRLPRAFRQVISEPLDSLSASLYLSRIYTERYVGQPKIWKKGWSQKVNLLPGEPRGWLKLSKTNIFKFIFWNNSKNILLDIILPVFYFNEFIPYIYGKVFERGSLPPAYIREGNWEGEISSRIYTGWALNVLKGNCHPFQYQNG